MGICFIGVVSVLSPEFSLNGLLFHADADVRRAFDTP